MPLPRPKPQKRANVPNTKDANGRGKKLVKAQHKGTVKKNVHDVASEKVHTRYATTGKGPRKTPRFKKGK